MVAPKKNGKTDTAAEQCSLLPCLNCNTEASSSPPSTCMHKKAAHLVTAIMTSVVRHHDVPSAL